jgi:RimJ/RimL family protein N-acetyltransferase
LANLIALWNDGRVMRWVGFPDGLGWDLQRARTWLARIDADPNRHHFVLEADGLGFAGELYYAVQPEHRRAGLDIKLRAEAHGRGIAAAGLGVLCDRVFANEPDVDAVWVEPSAVNQAARRLYSRLGFRPVERPADLPPAESHWELQRASGLHDKLIRASSTQT